MPRLEVPLYCSFCRRDTTVVARLIGGPGVFICDACTAKCVEILDGRAQSDFPGWTSLNDEALLDTLAPSAAAVDQVRAVLQEHVDLLRVRGVSWDRIGKALGISRQAAWERFS